MRHVLVLLHACAASALWTSIDRVCPVLSDTLVSFMNYLSQARIEHIWFHDHDTAVFYLEPGCTHRYGYYSFIRIRRIIATWHPFHLPGTRYIQEYY